MITKEELELYCKEAVNTYRGDFTNLMFSSFEEFEENELEPGKSYYVLTVAGGLNGRGQLLFYLEDVAKLVKKLMIRFNYVWLINWVNDCPDEVFYLEIGLRF